MCSFLYKFLKITEIVIYIFKWFGKGGNFNTIRRIHWKSEPFLRLFRHLLENFRSYFYQLSSRKKNKSMCPILVSDFSMRVKVTSCKKRNILISSTISLIYGLYQQHGAVCFVQRIFVWAYVVSTLTCRHTKQTSSVESP